MTEQIFLVVVPTRNSPGRISKCIIPRSFIICQWRGVWYFVGIAKSKDRLHLYYCYKEVKFVTF